MRVEISTYGPIAELIELTDPARIEQTMARLRRETLLKVATVYLERLRDNMYAGKAGGPPLTKIAVKLKGHDRKWVDTAAMVKSLSIQELTNEDIFVGVPNTAKNDLQEELQLIALINEIGDHRVPARPIFEPTAEAIANKSNDDFGLDAIVIREYLAPVIGQNPGNNMVSAGAEAFGEDVSDIF